MAALTGFIVAWTHRIQKLLWAGWILVTVGLGLLSTLTPYSSAASQYGFQIIIAIGGGFIFPTKIFAVQAVQTEQNTGTATAVVAFLTSLGQACGVAIGSVVFQTLWNDLVGRNVTSGAIPEMYIIDAAILLQNFTAINGMPVEIQELYREVLATSIGKGIWTTLTGFSGLAFFVSLLAKNVRLDEPSNKE
jgi:hypothetical protein